MLHDIRNWSLIDAITEENSKVNEIFNKNNIPEGIKNVFINEAFKSYFQDNEINKNQMQTFIDYLNENLFIPSKSVINTVAEDLLSNLRIDEFLKLKKNYEISNSSFNTSLENIIKNKNFEGVHKLLKRTKEVLPWDIYIDIIDTFAQNGDIKSMKEVSKVGGMRFFGIYFPHKKTIELSNSTFNTGLLKLVETPYFNTKDISYYSKFKNKNEVTKINEKDAIYLYGSILTLDNSSSEKMQLYHKLKELTNYEPSFDYKVKLIENVVVHKKKN